MSIVLYALGAALMAWGAYLMLAGESYAAIDIAASLAGWGAFTIGLGAVVASLNKLAGAVGRSRRGAEAMPPAGARQGRKGKAGKNSADKGGRRGSLQGEAFASADKSARKDEIVPMFVPATGSPAHFEPAAPKVATKPEPETRLADGKSAPPRPAPDAVRKADDQDASPARAMRSGFRRQAAAKLDEPKVATPPVAAAALGGGLALRSGSEKPAKPIEPEQANVRPLESAAEPVVAPKHDLGLDPSLTPNEDAATQAAKDQPAAETPADKPIMSIRHPAAEAPPVVVGDIAPTAEPEVPDAREVEGHEATVNEVSAPDEASSALEQAAEPEPQAAAEAASEPPNTDALAIPARAAAPEPKVPEWLARARARRRARIGTDVEPASEVSAPRFRNAAPPVKTVEPDLSPEAATPEDIQPEAAAPDASPSVVSEPNPEPVDASASPEPEMVSPDAAEPVDEPERQIVSEGEHNGVLYRFYDDGSVEAASEHGVRHFASVDDLRQAVLSARGPDYREPEVEDAAIAESPVEPRADGDPLDAALAELEGNPAPEIRIDPDDRRGAGEGR